MPRYEFRCRSCGDTFEVSRPMAASAEPTVCPQGHDDTVKLLSTVAVMGSRPRGQSAQMGSGTPAPRMPSGGGGGCCGGACGCG